MEKIITKYYLWIVVFVLFGTFIFGYINMYFHQDDLDWLILANRPFFEVMAQPLSDHINYIFRLILKIQWDIFGFRFAPYFTVSILIHFINVLLLHKLVDLTTNRKDLSAVVALIFVVNTNWTEIVLWFSGQTISITLTFMLLAMIALYKQKYRSISIFFASMTSALALPLIPASLFVWGKGKKRITLFGYILIALSILVLLLHKYRALDGTKIEMSLAWLGQVILVMGLGVINTVIGRLVLPFDRFEIFRIIAVATVLGFALYKNREKIMQFVKDKWNRFLGLQLFFYYLIVAVGRAQFGVGIMRAERYGYVGLALLLLLCVRMFRNIKIGKWVWIVPTILMIQVFGLYRRSEDYVKRPQQLKQAIEQVQKNRKVVNPDSYLPYEILNDERLKYIDLINLIGY